MSVGGVSITKESLISGNGFLRCGRVSCKRGGAYPVTSNLLFYLALSTSTRSKMLTIKLRSW